MESVPLYGEMRLCLASLHFFPIPGGAQLRFLRYLPGLKERGVYTIVVSATPKRRKLTAATRKKEWMERPVGEILAPELINGTVIFRLRLPERKSRRRAILFYSGLLRLLRDISSRPDVIQLLPSLHPASIPWLSRLRAALGQRARQWVEQTMDVERSLDRYTALYRELADEVRVRVHVQREADALITGG